MKRFSISIITISLVMSGCANVPKTGADNKAASAGAGAAIGCLGGAVLANLMGKNAASGCVAGAIVGGLVGFEKARQEELAAAEQARNDAVEALKALPPTQARDVRVSDVKTVEVTATDKNTHERKKYNAFSSVSVDIPLSAKGTPAYDSAMSKLKNLAERVANERGSSEINIAMTQQDAIAKKVELGRNVVRTSAGSPIVVTKSTDSTIPKGIERITVRAGNLNTDV